MRSRSLFGRGVESWIASGAVAPYLGVFSTVSQEKQMQAIGAVALYLGVFSTTTSNRQRSQKGAVAPYLGVFSTL